MACPSCQIAPPLSDYPNSPEVQDSIVNHSAVSTVRQPSSFLPVLIPVVVAFVLLTAVGFKVASLLHPTTADILRTHATPQPWPWLAALAQWLIALWLLTGLTATWAARVTLALLTLFLIIASYHWYTGAADCGCFGAVAVHPRWTVLLDGAMLVGIGLTTAKSRRAFASDSYPVSNLKSPRIFLGLAISLSIPTSTVLALAPQSNVDSPKTVFLDVDSWVGKKLPLLDYIESPIAEQLTNGSALVLLMDGNCAHCRDRLTQLRAERSEKLAATTFVVDISDTSSIDISPFAQLRLTRAVENERRRTATQYVARVPVEISLTSGKVVSLKEQYPR